MTTRPKTLLVTCEHGGNRLPAPYARLFRGRETLLNSHRGYDIGALALARRLARRLNTQLHYSTVSRLLVDLNRSEHHRAVFSIRTRMLEPATRVVLLRRYYFPYRNTVEERIRRAISRDRSVIHISVHSFTPVFDDRPRRTDVGLLYDPARSAERALVHCMRSALHSAAPELVVRRNYPYRGTADGFTTFLRRRFPATRYSGIEIEVNQRYALGPEREWRALQQQLVDAIARTLDH